MMSAILTWRRLSVVFWLSKWGNCGHVQENVDDLVTPVSRALFCSLNFKDSKHGSDRLGILGTVNLLALNRPYSYDHCLTLNRLVR